MTVNDAAYLYSLRNDARYSEHLSKVSGSVQIQRDWISDYKAREEKSKELYYVIERLDGTQCGFVRLYDIGKSEFVWGSWILDDNKPKKAALESAVLSFGVGFERLGLERAFIEVRRENTHATQFYRRFGMREIGSDDQSLHFEYHKAWYEAEKQEFIEKIGLE